MASSSSQTAILLFILLAFSSFKSSESELRCIAVYWGQNGSEGTLRNACINPVYGYVTIGFLTTFGGGQEPVLNLTGHCKPSSGTCRRLSKDIPFCQKRGIKVLLSLGGPIGSYYIASRQDAKHIASYLWTNFLAPDSKGPLRNAHLDGIDFDIVSPLNGSNLYWDDLARELAKYRPQKYIHLSAAPQCPYPDRYLDDTIQTGLLDYVWLQFYNNPSCNYIAWKVWSSSLPKDTQLFLGLLASPQAGSGYITPPVVNDDILPVIRDSKNYGGVLLWNRYYDLLTNYSSEIYHAACYPILKLPSDGLSPN